VRDWGGEWTEGKNLTYIRGKGRLNKGSNPKDFALGRGGSRKRKGSRDRKTPLSVQGVKKAGRADKHVFSVIKSYTPVQER